jgi:hypothetical protein
MKLPRRGDRLSTYRRLRRLSLKPLLEQFEQRTLLSSAAFVTTDATTQGTWRGTYGSQGYAVPANATAFNGLTLSGQSSYVWVASTTDPRAAQTAPPDPPTSRIASAWYSATSFTADVDVSDGLTHQLAVYFDDRDSGPGGRQQTVEVLDGSSGAVLDTHALSNFRAGEYLIWNVSGHVQVRVTNTNPGANAVISALFLDPSTASALAAPGGVTAVGSVNLIDVSWDDVSAAQGYRIERSENGGPFSEIGTTLAGVTTFTDTGPVSGTTYSYRVRASGASGLSPYSDVVTARSFADDTPVVVSPASAVSQTVTGTSDSLSVLGDVPGGESLLIYTWSVVAQPADAPLPTFSDNDTNSAKNVMVDFHAAGTYTFRVTLQAGFPSVTSDVTVVVEQTMTGGLQVSPGYVNLRYGALQQFTALAADQFGNSMALPSGLTWTISGANSSGSITPAGLYTAPFLDPFSQDSGGPAIYPTSSTL